MENILRSDILKFMNREVTAFEIPDSFAKLIFSENEEEAKAAEATFFGYVNRALRQYCIQVSEYLYQFQQYGLIHSVLSFWSLYHHSLYDLANSIAESFEANSNRDVLLPSGTMFMNISSQITRVGFRIWNKYILSTKGITQDLPSYLELITESPAIYPFINSEFTDEIKNILNDISKSSNFTSADFYRANLISTIVHLFIMHPACYPEDLYSKLTSLSYLTDSLFVSMKYSPSNYSEFKDQILSFIREMSDNLKTFTPSVMQFTLFMNPEYQDLMKMIYCCSPESYLDKEITRQINYIVKSAGIPLNSVASSHFQQLLPLYSKSVIPMFEAAISIVSDSVEARRKFSEEFCSLLFPRELLREASTLFGTQREYLRNVWNMVKLIPGHVTMISNAFIKQMRPKIELCIKRGEEDRLQELVIEINSLVEREFEMHPVMVLARSKLFIPYQRDHELIGRARVLVEQAHIPQCRNNSIAELFEIVPCVKSRGDLLDSLSAFVMNQLLSQVEPCVELERFIFDSMGQYTESEYIQPLQRMLKEFCDRYAFFNELFEMHPPKGVRIALLSNQHWKTIAQRGQLSCFDVFSGVRAEYQQAFSQKKKNMTLIWCDPSSVVEVEINVDGGAYPFLFNGVQYAILSLLQNGETAYSVIAKEVPVSDLEEQLSTLIESGLVYHTNEKKDVYAFTKKVDVTKYRNYAKFYTSAEKLAFMQMKEKDKQKAMQCAIVREVKKASNGLSINDIVHLVTVDLKDCFSVSPDMVREMVRELEITKFIKLKENTTNIFEYLP